VGCCSELLNGKPGDTLGKAGYFAPPMQREKLADAMERLCESRELRLQMGEIGQKRTYENFRYEIMLTIMDTKDKIRLKVSGEMMDSGMGKPPWGNISNGNSPSTYINTKTG
jgi:hypothetical protein